MIYKELSQSSRLDFNSLANIGILESVREYLPLDELFQSQIVSRDYRLRYNYFKKRLVQYLNDLDNENTIPSQQKRFVILLSALDNSLNKDDLNFFETLLRLMTCKKQEVRNLYKEHKCEQLIKVCEKLVLKESYHEAKRFFNLLEDDRDTRTKALNSIIATVVKNRNISFVKHLQRFRGLFLNLDEGFAQCVRIACLNKQINFAFYAASKIDGLQKRDAAYDLISKFVAQQNKELAFRVVNKKMTIKDKQESGYLFLIEKFSKKGEFKFAYEILLKIDDYQKRRHASKIFCHELSACIAKNIFKDEEEISSVLSDPNSVLSTYDICIKDEYIRDFLDEFRISIRKQKAKDAAERGDFSCSLNQLNLIEDQDKKSKFCREISQDLVRIGRTEVVQFVDIVVSMPNDYKDEYIVGLSLHALENGHLNLALDLIKWCTCNDLTKSFYINFVKDRIGNCENEEDLNCLQLIPDQFKLSVASEIATLLIDKKELQGALNFAHFCDGDISLRFLDTQDKKDMFYATLCMQSAFCAQADSFLGDIPPIQHIGLSCLLSDIRKCMHTYYTQGRGREFTDNLNRLSKNIMLQTRNTSRGAINPIFLDKVKNSLCEFLVCNRLENLHRLVKFRFFIQFSGAADGRINNVFTNIIRG